ncbi:Sec-independent protein translocase protein TatC [Desulfuromonas versatilis]|uniref:Sec-independent protein translocase protein TatC n=1 Tax=Desulfuromonas versatilis TaxID=2802975 RepID=A0ABN6DUU6_9BACT|nr:twin-arginine translocase subunit TatC [Desulfuromonas versatilis]BCR02966.1 Sec-independent protein translocase protein TatC [Desulfuromonas versatilis]
MAAEVEQELPFTSHLEELRKRLMIAGGTWLVAFMACYSFAERLFTFVSEPVRSALPEGSSLVFINATEPFFTYLKVGAIAGLLIALPVIFWQLWAFVAPGLYSHEKKLAVPFVIASTLCFGAGTYFGFTFVFPTIFTFLIKFGTGSGEINAMLSMGSYLTLSFRLLMAFGLVFELPIGIFFLARMGVVDHRWLAKNRKYALLLAFVIGAILTPPDVFSQTAIALPFIILYEVGIIVARLFGKKKAVEEPEEKAEETGQA